MSIPSMMLRLESAAFLSAAIAVQIVLGESWVWFVLFLILPDIGIAAYLLGPRAGAVLYNLFHLSLFPIALLLTGLLADGAVLLSLGCGWAAHIAVDRVVGYGLKYRDNFKHTHLQEL